jgi:hypothetical protein
VGWRDTITKESPQEKSSWRATITKEPTVGQQAEDFVEATKEGLPFAGLASKAASGLMAGAQNTIDLFSDRPDKTFAEHYQDSRNWKAGEVAERTARSPKLTIAGNMVGAIAAPNPSSIAGRVGLNVADAATRAENYDELKSNAGTAGAVSVAAESLPFIGKGLKSAANKTATKAEALAVKATGATGKQSERFAEQSGRELLDQGVVKAFYSPEKVAGKAGKQLEAAYGEIDTSLKALDQAGAFVSKDEVVEALQKEASQLPKGPSGATARKRLQDEIDETIAGPEKYSLQEAELEKRTYQHQANYDEVEAVKDIKRKVARAWRNTVETKATALNPELSETFKVGKQRFATFAPIEEAAAKRAKQLNQSPYGGLLDMVSVAGGVGSAFASDDPQNALYGVGLAALRRGLAPRTASTLAVGLDKAAKGMDRLGNTPRIGAAGQMAITRGLSYPGQNRGIRIPER